MRPQIIFGIVGVTILALFWSNSLEARGIRNNNPGNIRSTRPFDPLKPEWKGQVGTDDRGFVKFGTPEEGVRAMAIAIIHRQQQGWKTLQDLGDLWAPASDNGGDDNYGARIAARLGLNPDTAINFVNYLPGIINGIVLNENGHNPYSAAVVMAGIAQGKAYTGVA